MKTRSICRRCHRIRVVDGTRCCAACNTELRAMERRRPVAPLDEPPTHRLPDDAFTPEEQAVFFQQSSVDAEATLAWMNGEGPDPWPVDKDKP